MGIEVARRGGEDWITIPYISRGQTVCRKWRATGEKKFFMDPAGKPCLFNCDVLDDPRLKTGEAALIITEGELDAVAATQAGFLAVSVPTGAPAVSGDLSSERYRPIREEPRLAAVRKIILATDSDEPGLRLRADLANILGPSRCRFVPDYGEGCKDLGDVLAKGDAELVREIIESNKPYPIRGLYSWDEIPDLPPLQPLPIGIPAVGDALPLVPGSLTVGTGFPNHGKTTFALAVAALFMRRAPVALASFETIPKPIMRALISCTIDKVPTSIHYEPRPETAKLIHENSCVIGNFGRNPSDDLDLDGVLDAMAAAVIRNGARLCIIDPWNKVEHFRHREESETDYTGRALNDLMRFARSYDVALWVLAHPRKPMGAGGTTQQRPDLADISGSMHWANRPDYGFCVWRPKEDAHIRELHVTKVRLGYPGKRAVINLDWDYRISNFR
ncbi:MAG: hypothetical protein CFK52_13730, partial [Chloracidobacterium sp. CP2_5A]